MKNVTAQPCEMQTFSPGSKLFSHKNLPNLKTAGCYVAEKLNFLATVSKELLAVTIVCVDTPFQSFLIVTTAVSLARF